MKIALLGDISLNGRYDVMIDKNAISRVKYLQELVSDCDFVIANLESPFTRKKKTLVCKGAYLSSNPESINVLKSIGVTHVTLANNHIFDYGIKGAEDTINTLDENGIDYVGLNNEPSLMQIGDDKALLEGFCCYSANGIKYGKKHKNSIKELNYEELKKFFKKSNELGALPIASVHFGIEGVHYPSVEHRNLFRSCSSENNYILHGNHPHAIQGYEKINDSYLYYALGDLCFDTVTETSINRPSIQTDESRESYIVKMLVEENKCVHTEVITVSDLRDGIISVNKDIQKNLDEYCSNLCLDDAHLENIRKEEQHIISQNSQIRNIKFYLDRLNYKYIGAFLNGKIHSIKYSKIMKNYKRG